MSNLSVSAPTTTSAEISSVNQRIGPDAVKIAGLVIVSVALSWGSALFRNNLLDYKDKYPEY